MSLVNYLMQKALSSIRHKRQKYSFHFIPRNIGAEKNYAHFFLKKKKCKSLAKSCEAFLKILCHILVLHTEENSLAKE